MFLSKIAMKNFRKYIDTTVDFHKGLNALIGENNSGKSAIIDAIKIVFNTQSAESIRVTDDDFHISENNARSSELSINCVIEDLSDDEAKNFIEYASFTKSSETSSCNVKIYLYFRAWKEGNRIFSSLRAGNPENGPFLDGRARELLKCVYLRPLRDAEREMHSGKNSRISQILYNHPLFIDKEDNKLVDILKNANDDIERYFLNEDGCSILSNLRETLREFISDSDNNKASIETSSARLKQILESLSLAAPETNPGLGTHNLLFIAAELLLLGENINGSLKLALIEELEAHLHPQAQLRLIDYLQKKYNELGVQIIISTHSPILASKINVKNLILIKDQNAYDLVPERTQLSKGDYLFLQRFLDSTKANFFFAKGIIMVEGDAEALFIPILADILGINLEKFGISIVKVGSVGFFRYSNIFLRSNGDAIPIPVSVITDCDIAPQYKERIFDIRIAETAKAIMEKERKYTKGNIRAFIAPRWTFEYSIGLSCLSNMLYESIFQANKIENSEQYALTSEKIEKVEKELEEFKSTLSGLSSDEVAYKFYHDCLLSKKTSKAIVAQCLASNLKWSVVNFSNQENTPPSKELMFNLDLYQTKINEDKRIELKDRFENDPYLRYIIDAIKHAAKIG